MPSAKAAIDKEINSMNSKRVWDVDDVYSLHDLLRTKDMQEAMLGRAFQIFGVKGEELSSDEQVWKGRIVFQGSNIRIKKRVCKPMNCSKMFRMHQPLLLPRELDLR